MLSRRHLRTKVLQALYAFIQSGNNDLASGEKHLVKSIDKLHELYITQLSLLLEIIDFASNRIEESKKKYFPTQEDLNPNTRFIDNPITRQIEENDNYKQYYKKYKISWSDEKDMIRKLYNEIKEGKFYQKYLDNQEHSYEADQDVLIKITKKKLAEFELLENYYEDKTVFWSFEDFYTANMMVIKTLKQYKMDYGPGHPLPSIYKESVDDDDEDRQFMLELFRKCVLHYEEYRQLIAGKAKNWELDRIAIMDIILITMALAELTEFPSIPVKVTMNEYIEISKYYSSAKSKVFINGILDKLVADLKANNKIKKAGRGLLDN